MPDPCPPSRSLDIGLDVDGVLYPFVSVIAGYATTVLGRPCSDVAHSWNWYELQWGLTSDEFFELCGHAVHDRILFTEGAPLPGAVETARGLAEAGHRLHYITARAIAGVSPSLAWHRTRDWLDAWGFPVDSLTISSDKSCRPTDVFLDDGPHVCDALLAVGHPRPVLWTHEPGLSHAAETVATWDEFLAIVDDLSCAVPSC